MAEPQSPNDIPTDNASEANAEASDNVTIDAAASTNDTDATEDTSNNNSEQQLAEQLAAAEAKAAENWDQFVRARAEADNAIKRAQREIDNARKFAIERFANDLLTVVDSLNMGLEAAGGEDASLETLLEGMELTQKQLASVLERFQVEIVNPVGEKFNPEFHEAMTMVPSPEHEPNTVMDVVQKGYTLNGRLLRPARVVVAKAAG